MNENNILFSEFFVFFLFLILFFKTIVREQC